MAVITVERLVLGLANSGGGWSYAERRIICSTKAPDGRAGRGKTILRCFQCLVRGSELIFERVKLRIVVDFPPGSLGDGIARRREFPLLAGLFVGCRSDNGRSRVFRADGAAAQRKHGKSKNECAFHRAYRAPAS